MKLLDVVVLLSAYPEEGLAEGQRGTVVELLDADTVLVEFSDCGGVALAIVPVARSCLAHYVGHRRPGTESTS